MREKFRHRFGVLILAVVVLSGVAMLGSTTAQAWGRRRVIVAPQIYIGSRPYYRHRHHHWRYYGSRPYYRHWRRHGRHYGW